MVAMPQGKAELLGAYHEEPMIRAAPQIATRIPATNSHTFPFRTNAAHARAASAASARRSISLKYSTMKPIKTSQGAGLAAADVAPDCLIPEANAALADADTNFVGALEPAGGHHFHDLVELAHRSRDQVLAFLGSEPGKRGIAMMGPKNLSATAR